MKYLYRPSGRIWHYISILLILMFHVTKSHAQDRVYMYLNYFQNADGESLVAEVKYRDEERQFQQLASVEIKFYQLLEDDDEILLGTTVSGEDGKATLDLSEIKYNRDSLGRATFESRFAGNDNYRSADRDIETIRAKLIMSLDIVDSVKHVTINGIEINNRNTPIPEADIQLLVKRTYSDLPIGQGSLDDGEWEIEFPNDLPGDPFGNLNIIARIIEHDEYGTLEVDETAQWGTLVPIEIQKNKRALWGRPPLWIIISVYVTLIAAWFHYLLAIYNLRKIRRT